MNWTALSVARPDMNLYLEVAGSGAPLLVLSGGPGDSCAYMKPAVQPLLESRTLLLLDQRGTGQSEMANLSPQAFGLPLLLEDFEAVRLELGVSQLEVLGHSWGANLGLLYAAFYPNSVKKLLAIAPGPINATNNAVAGVNLTRGFDDTQLAEFAQIRLERQKAENDLLRLRQLHQLSATRFWAKNAIYSAEARAKFIQAFDATQFHPLVHRYVWQGINWDALEPMLSSITAPLGIVYGYQDFEPITQAHHIKELVPQAQLEFINGCGHVPWLDQPEAFAELLRRFFRASSA